MARAFIRLEEVINDYMARRDEDDYDKYVGRPKAMAIARSLLTELSPSVDSAFRAVRLDVNTNNQSVILPPDFMKESFVGLYDEHSGNVIPLGRNDNLMVAGDVLKDNNGDDLLDNDGVQLLSDIIRTNNSSATFYYDNPFFWNFYRNHGLGGEYGQGGGNNVFGYYKVNKIDNRIELSINTSVTQIVLEYQADLSIMENPIIDSVLKEAMISGIYYRAIKHKSRVPMGEKQIAKRTYYQDRKDAINILRSMTKEEWLQQFRKNTQATPKY